MSYSGLKSTLIQNFSSRTHAKIHDHLPQIKHVFLSTSSLFCFSLLRSANVSIMTPNIKLRTIMMTTKKKSKSYTTRPTNMFSFMEGRLRTSPIPPPFLSPWFRVVMMHIIRVSQARSFTESSPSELVSESEMEPSQLLSASQVAEDAVEYKKKKVKTCAQLKEAAR